MIVLAGVGDGHHSKGGEAAYSQYVRHLEKTSAAVLATKQPGTVENFAQGYQDFLQAPLQPLMDNLPSVTYQTFEQDPVKYAQYEEVYHQFRLYILKSLTRILRQCIMPSWITHRTKDCAHIFVIAYSMLTVLQGSLCCWRWPWAARPRAASRLWTGRNARHPLLSSRKTQMPLSRMYLSPTWRSALFKS